MAAGDYKGINWDDLRFVLALSRAAGLNAAARVLGMAPSSVYRRLESLESSLGARLFERLRTGYRPTIAGEEIAEAAERMEAEALHVQRRVLGADVRLQGNIRIATSEPLLLHMLGAHFAEFRVHYPDVTLDVTLSNQHVDLSRRAVDIVIRATSAPHEHLVGRSLGPVNSAAYATSAYLEAQGRGKPIAEYDWVGYAGESANLEPARWVAQNVPDERVKLRFDSICAVHDVVARGAGCGALPCFVGDGDPRLERIPETFRATDVQMWVLTHPDLRKSARIRAALRFFGERLESASARFAGRSEEPA